jgi:CheY-specific phosphatase CheX
MGGAGQDSGNVQAAGVGSTIGLVATIRKAIAAAISVGTAVYVSSAILNNELEQLAAAVAAGIVAGVLVWRIPNAAA